MTKELYIDGMAAQAMQALLSADYEADERIIAAAAYAQADAMWAERQKRAAARAEMGETE